MTSVFSAISGVFGRAMIIGALLPASLFVLFCHLFLLPMLPWQWQSVARLEALEPEWKVVAAAAAAIVLAGLLHVLNIPIIRFYEGYPWKNGPIGKWLRKQREAEFDEKIARRREAIALRPQLPPGDPRIGRLWTLQDDVDREMMAVHPPRSLLLPTRLGNVIRSFESYPSRQYGISAIILWPRFASRLSAEHARSIEEAKTSFDVTVHLSFLSLLAALLLLAAGCAYPIPFVSWTLLWPWLLRILAAGLAAWLLYVASVSRARAWGDTVRAAFDLHRAAVLKDLGIAPLPRDLETERLLWTRISQQIIFGDPERGPSLRFNATTLVFPDNDDLLVTRGMAPTSKPNVNEITVRVENKGRSDEQNVRIAETLPDGAQMVFESATAPVTGCNPYFFELGDIAKGQTRAVSYRVVTVKS